jgi:hypothetical protein
LSKLLVVEGDPVDGTDTHAVSGVLKLDPTKPYVGTGDYAYGGKVSGGVSDFVTVDGKGLAVVTSSSTLRKDSESGHQPKNGSNFTPPGPELSDLKFVPPTSVGSGKPGGAAGSSLLTVSGTKVLLDDDPFDTCGIPGGIASSTVAAETQSFVTCST